MHNVASINHGNCFTVDRLATPAFGISLSLVSSGEYCALFTKRGISIDLENPCRVVHDRQTGIRSVFHAGLNYCKFSDGYRHAFEKVHPHESKSALVKVALHSKIVTQGRRAFLQEYTNHYSEGVYFGLPKGLAGYDGDSSLVKILLGEKFSCFFADGGVRSFYYNGFTLMEIKLSSIEVVRLRIERAWKMIEFADMSRPEDQARLTKTALFQILNFFFYIETHEDREVLFEEFFLRLPKDVYELIEKRLRHTLYLVDKSMHGHVQLLGYSKKPSMSNVISMSMCRGLKK
jgi:hypothetical protein